MVKQTPGYAKFLKELCITKGILQGNERIKLNENVSTPIQKKLLEKHNDLRTFTIRCTICNTIFIAMLDLSVLINVMPYSILSF